MALDDFIRRNINVNATANDARAAGRGAAEAFKSSWKGAMGKGFTLFEVASIATSDNKLKSVLKTLKDMILFRATLSAGFAALFFGMGKAIKSLVHDTGSLDAAMRKLGQIQGLQHVFAPLTGGVAAAKAKVAELVNFAATRNIKLGDAAEASRSLSILTRNGFSSAKALDVVNDAAEATGNSVVAVANAVGEFSSQLQSGGSISGATEQMRQMGLVSNETADQLSQLQKNGATTSETFTALVTSLGQFSGGAKAAADDIESVNRAYEKAGENLKEEFGSPWVESDVQNTKNVTAALTALAPTVKRVSTVWSILFNGFSTAKTNLLKFATASQGSTVIIEGLAYALTALVAVAGLLGATSLIAWLGGIAITAESAAVAIGALALASGGFVVVAAVAIGIGLQLGAAFDKLSKKHLELIAAQNQAAAALAKQIAGARTLEEQQNALAAAISAVAEAERDVTKARSEGPSLKDQILGIDKLAEAEAKLAIARKNLGRAQLGKPLAGREEEQARDMKARQEHDKKEAEFQAKLGLALPGERAKMLRERVNDLKARVETSEGGRTARVAGEQKAVKDVNTLKDAEAKRAIAKERFDSLEKDRQEQLRVMDHARGETGKEIAYIRIGAIEKQQAAVNKEIDKQDARVKSAREEGARKIAAPKGSTIALERERERALADTTIEGQALKADRLRRIDKQLAGAKINEEEEAQNRLEIIRTKAEQAEIARSVSLAKIKFKGETDLQQAEIEHDTRRESALKDREVFIEKFNELSEQGVGKEEAAGLASKFAGNAITLEGGQAQIGLASAAVADSLTRIGGGGGFYAPGGADPMLSLAQKQLDLQQEVRDYLKEIADAGRGVL